jgi:microcystin-dependent protein
VSNLSEMFNSLHGVILPYAGTAAPNGFLLCYGQAVSRTAYAALFSVISTTYGVGDGSTTFNLPDLRGRAVAGKDDMGGSAANRLGVTISGTRASTSTGVITGLSSTAGLSIGMKASGTGIGTSAVISSIDSGTQVTLSVNSTATGTANIRFGVVDGATLGDAGGAQVHTLVTDQMPSHNHVQNNVDAFPLIEGAGWSRGLDAGDAAKPITRASKTSNSTGGGQAHANVQPTLVLNYIIKT